MYYTSLSHKGESHVQDPQTGVYFYVKGRSRTLGAPNNFTWLWSHRLRKSNYRKQFWILPVLAGFCSRNYSVQPLYYTFLLHKCGPYVQDPYMGYTSMWETYSTPGTLNNFTLYSASDINRVSLQLNFEDPIINANPSPERFSANNIGQLVRDKSIHMAHQLYEFPKTKLKKLIIINHISFIKKIFWVKLVKKKKDFSRDMHYSILIETV